MENFLTAIFTETLSAPTWEILVLLAVVSICMLVHASRIGILITYVFTLHLSFNFLSNHFGELSLMILGVLSAIVLILGIISVFNER